MCERRIVWLDLLDTLKHSLVAMSMSILILRTCLFYVLYVSYIKVVDKILSSYHLFCPRVTVDVFLNVYKYI